MGLEPGRDLPIRAIFGHVGRESRAALERAWGGAQVFDRYGVADPGPMRRPRRPIATACT
jgi:phenylacetate-CoA ligase